MPSEPGTRDRRLSNSLSQRQDSISPAVILQDAHVVERRVFGGDLLGGLALVESDFQENPAGGFEVLGCGLKDSAMKRQAVQAAVEGGDRFVVTHAAVQRFDLSARNVRRIRHDQMKRARIDALRNRLEQITLLGLYAL